MAAACGSVALPVEVVTNYAISADAVIDDMTADLGSTAAIPVVWPSPPYPQFVKDVSFTVSSDVSLKDNGDVADMMGRMRDVRLDHIDYALLENTLNKDISSLDFMIGPKGGAGVTAVAHIPGIAAGQRASGRAALDPDGRLEAVKYLDILDFACGAAVTVPIDTTLDPKRPSGAVQLRVTIGLIVSGDPV